MYIPIMFCSPGVKRYSCPSEFFIVFPSIQRPPLFVISNTLLSSARIILISGCLFHPYLYATMSPISYPIWHDPVPEIRSSTLVPFWINGDIELPSTVSYWDGQDLKNGMFVFLKEMKNIPHPIRMIEDIMKKRYFLDMDYL